MLKTKTLKATTELEKQALQFTVLQEVNRLIAADWPTEKTLLAVLQVLIDTFEYRAAQIYQLSPSNDDLWLYVELGPGLKPVTPTTDIFSVDEKNIISDTIRGDAPICIADMSNGPYSYYQNEANAAISSELTVPLKFGVEALGVLRLQSSHLNGFDTKNDVPFFLSLGNLLGLTIRNNRQIQGLQDSIQEIKTLYHFYQEQLEQYESDSSKRATGYQYHKNTVSKADGLLQHISPGLEERSGITTIEGDDFKELVAPIQLNGETIGLLGIENSPTQAGWSADDIRFIEEVTSQVALAIENSRLIQETQARTKELSILFEATRQLTETINLNQIYDILTAQLVNYLRADKCSVLLLNQARTHFELAVSKTRHQMDGPAIRQAETRIMALEDYPSLQEMIKQPGLTIYHLADPAVETMTKAFMAQEQGRPIHTLTRFPLIVRSKLVAFLELEHLHEPHAYTQNELQLAQAIIAQVTVAIENAQLFQQTELALAETQNLYDISRALVESTDIEDIFDVVLENVKAFDVDRVSISLLDRSQSGEIETVTIAATWDRDPSKILPIGTQFSGENFALVHTFAQPPFHPLISEDLRQEAGQDERMDEAFRHFAQYDLGAVTMFSAPMFLGAEYKGVLSIYTRKAHIYNEREIRIYQTLADQAIVAIERRRLLEATQKERDRAALLYQLGQQLSKTITIEEANEVILNFTPHLGLAHSEIFITDSSDFMLVSSTVPQRQQLEPVALNSTVMTFFERLGILSLSHREKTIKLKSDMSPLAWPLADVTALVDVEAFACIPFQASRSGLQGMLIFYHTDPNGFSEDQLVTFEAIANQTAATLDTVWLLRQTNLALSETELLYRATTGFNSAQTFEDLLMVLVDSIAGSGADFMAIALTADVSPGSSPEVFEIVADWNRATQEIATPGVYLTPDQFSFTSQLRPNAAKEIHYSRLDPITQANVDQYLGQTRTILSIPLAVGRNWLGVLLVANRTENFIFKVSTINQIFTLAGQAAVIIQNLQLVEETQQNLYNSEILSSLGQQLLTADSEDEIYTLVLAAIAATEPDRGAAILMYDRIEGLVDLEIVALWDNPNQAWPPVPLGARFSTEELGLVPMLKTGETVMSKDAPNDNLFAPTLRQLFNLMQIKVMVAAPLWLNQEVNGFILISNQSRATFTAEVIRLYEDIARQASGALENRRLVEEAQYRAAHLQTAAEVSQAATSYLDLNTLLSQSVDLIRDRFGYYHVSIFLVDEYRQYAVIQASTGEIGQKMLAMRHKLEVGGRSIVGTATGTGKPRIALDVGKDAIHFNNPLLPNTRSEMALPLIAQGQVIGALDVQSTKRGAFSESDITILQSMANQLANAIEAARAFQESKEALAEVNKLHSRYVREQWNAYLNDQRLISGYHLLDNGLILEYKGENVLRAETQEALAAQKPVIISTSPQTSNGKNKPETNQTQSSEWLGDAANDSLKLIAPLTLNNTVIGAVDFDLSRQEVDRIWDDDIRTIVEAITTQAAQAIESARLFEQTQVSREEAQALYEVGRTLVTAGSETEMFNAILGKMLAIMGLKQGGVLLINEDGQWGKLHALYKEGRPVKNPNLEFPIAGNPSYDKLIATKKPVIIQDMATDPLVAKVRELGLAGNIISLLLAPIIINDEVIGALGADAVGKKHIFSEREVNLALAMADQLAIAMQNRRLIEETRKRAVLLQTSADVGRVASSLLNQEELMDETVELIKERFGFHHAQIFLIDERGQFAVLHKGAGESGQKPPGISHKLAVGSQSVIGQVTYQRKPIVIRLTDSPDPDMPYRRNEFLPDTQAELAIPLQVGDTLIGALDVQSTQADAFTQEEISTLETLTSQLAVAIQNARAFKEQQETAERLREIDKLKTQFLANMSHELRTPLNSIIGFSRVILKGIDGPLTELQKADLTSIHNSGQHLLGLINNILDLSKIEAGKMELNFAETEVEPIVKTVMSTAVALAKEKNLTLDQEIPDDLPKIWADATRIRQILLNLVSNACKFTEDGAVTTKVRADKDKVIFSVSDTGIGIPQGQMNSVFEEFTQVDASTTRKVGGTGLGLPISRHFVELHHGEMWVESQPGQGSTFYFYIPIKASVEETATIFAEPFESHAPKAKKQVVAIDDDPSVVTLYRRFLEKQNIEVIGIDHLSDIITQVKEIAPVAILLDVILPNKDGWSILKSLKEDSQTKDIPVIMCSIISDKNRGFSLGATGYLTKPIAEERLISVLNQLDHPEKAEVKVLVVDDQADDILLIRRILEAQPNHTILEASNGKEALDLIEHNEPDLIILDLKMPEMDGFATIAALKEHERTRAIPIIIVSGQDFTRDEQSYLTGQVEALLHKGLFTENELLEDVSRALEKVGREEKITI